MNSIIDFFRHREAGKTEFTRLLRPHVETMYHMAWHWTRSQDDAEDLVQDVLVKLADKVSVMRDVDQLRPWLIKVLYHRYVDLYRRERTAPFEEEAPEDQRYGMQLPDSRADASLHQIRVDLESAIDSLGDDQKNVLMLHDVEGYTNIEVAEALDISIGTVKSRLHRARGKLKKILEPGGTFAVPEPW